MGLAGAIVTVVTVGVLNFASVDTGQVFGFAPNGCVDIRFPFPRAIGEDLADALAVLAEVPVCTFAVAVIPVDVDFHVVRARRGQIFFEADRISHRNTPSLKEVAGGMGTFDSSR